MDAFGVYNGNRYMIIRPKIEEYLAESSSILRRGESIRADGKYQFKYHIDGKPK